MKEESNMVWAKLNSITKQKVQSVKIKEKEFKMGRLPENDV